MYNYLEKGDSNGKNKSLEQAENLLHELVVKE